MSNWFSHWLLQWSLNRALTRLTIDGIVTRDALTDAETSYRAAQTNELADAIIELRKLLVAIENERLTVVTQLDGVQTPCNGRSTT